MIKELIDIGLTATNVASLKNNFKKADTKEKLREVQRSNRQISNFRNFAYILRRLVS